MVSANRTKPPDKHDVCRKVAALLKKAYASSPAARAERPVLETLLYAACLENAPVEQADAVYARLLNAFHDLNEVRVSSITELQAVFEGQEDAGWRALRIKSTLQNVFETNYAFDFDSLRRKTAELAAKHLSKIHGMSYFVQAYVLQHCLGSHILPVDAKSHAALVWLNLADRESTPEQAAEALRPFVRKADATLFCHWIHCLATDPKRNRAFTAAPAKSADASADPVARLEQLLRRGPEAQRAKSSKMKSGGNGKPQRRAGRGRLSAKKHR